MKQIPFVDFPKNKETDSPPSDGLYATISHNPGFPNHIQFGMKAFPWRTTIYEFKGGTADERGSGSDAGDMLSRWDVVKVVLIGIDTSERKELDDTLVKFGVELITEERYEALQKLLSLRPVAGTDQNFDYEKGRFKD